MKNFLLALMVVLTTCTLAIAQNQTTVVRDSVGKVKVTVTKDNKAKTNQEHLYRYRSFHLPLGNHR